ncbi:hypothetical protein GVAV_001685 [Gurleya vavrai]
MIKNIKCNFVSANFCILPVVNYAINKKNLISRKNSLIKVFNGLMLKQAKSIANETVETSLNKIAESEILEDFIDIDEFNEENNEICFSDDIITKNENEPFFFKIGKSINLIMKIIGLKNF